jgi:hypothetical protein
MKRIDNGAVFNFCKGLEKNISPLILCPSSFKKGQSLSHHTARPTLICFLFAIALRRTTFIKQDKKFFFGARLKRKTFFSLGSLFESLSKQPLARSADANQTRGTNASRVFNKSEMRKTRPAAQAEAAGVVFALSWRSQIRFTHRLRTVCVCEKFIPSLLLPLYIYGCESEARPRLSMI